MPANEITDLDPAEVFLHRKVANLVVHSDLNALRTIQHAVEHLFVKPIVVVGHHGCAGVRVALRGLRIGPAAHWLDHLPPEQQEDMLCEMNVIEQPGNVTLSTVTQDAWARGQPVAVHGWTHGLKDGLPKDLGLTMQAHTELADAFARALKRYPRDDSAGLVRATHQHHEFLAAEAEQVFMTAQATAHQA